MKKDIQLVWFKKNLRIKDNQVFQKLNSDIETIGFFLLEDEIIKQSDFSYFHLKFIIESLIELKKNLKKLNIKFIFKKYSFEKFILNLEKDFNIVKIVSTQETGNMASYIRDKRVIKFLKNENIDFEEVENNGVVRRLKNRDNWTKIWNIRMGEKIFKEKIFKSNISLKKELEETDILLNNYYEKTKKLKNQKGGEEKAIKILNSFLEKRVEKYSYNISKPFDSTDSCSRLSAYITYGNISIKYIYHESLKKILELKSINDDFSKKKIKQINFFLSRIHWQSHFIQKLESEPEIEFENMFKDYNKIRNIKDDKIINDFFNAKTGIPYIDACIICLKNTGRLNFRSRACITSYICNTMLQPWQSISKKLACLFTDYEPGIHYSQLQMQAGTSGINTIRIYNPIKQSKEKDPDGKFIKKWLPDLSKIDNKYIHEPWLYPEKIKGYEKEIEIDRLNKKARDIIWGIKKENKNKKVLKRIYKKHGSRKSSIKKKEEVKKKQLTIF